MSDLKYKIGDKDGGVSFVANWGAIGARGFDFKDHKQAEDINKIVDNCYGHITPYVAEV